MNQLAHEVRGLLVVRGVLGLFFYASLFAWLFDLRVGAWPYLPIPVAARWVAVWSLVPALLFFAWGFASLGTNYRGGVGLHEDHELVTTGAYRLVRHPIHVGFVTIMLLAFVVSASWPLGLSGLLLVLSIGAVRIPVEERQLSDRFGRAWETYRTQTGRLLPRARH